MTVAGDFAVLGPDVQAPAVDGPNVLDARVAGVDVGVGWPPAQHV